MAKIEQGSGKLLSVDTEKKTLRFQEITRGPIIKRLGETTPKPREWECPHALEWKDEDFFELVGKKVEYVLSDGAVVSLKSAS